MKLGTQKPIAKKSLLALAPPVPAYITTSLSLSVSIWSNSLPRALFRRPPPGGGGAPIPPPPGLLPLLVSSRILSLLSHPLSVSIPFSSLRLRFLDDVSSLLLPLPRSSPPALILLGVRQSCLSAVIAPGRFLVLPNGFGRWPFWVLLICSVVGCGVGCLKLWASAGCGGRWRGGWWCRSGRWCVLMEGGGVVVPEV